MSDLESRRRVWVLDWRLLLFAGLFLPVLLALGVWQLDRADQKQSSLDRWNDPSSAADWGGIAQAELVVGQPVVLTGHYGEATWLLDNRTREGVPGYEVLTLFDPDKGPPVVVNRGWLPAPRLRDRLPDLNRPLQRVRLMARVADYPQPPVLAEKEQRSVEPDGWPVRVQALPRERVVGLSPGVSALTVRLENPAQTGAYRADWEPDMMGPQTHYGYALQWFSLAVALIILTIIASYRKQES